jgi:oligopeptide transport system permease protein
MVPLVRNIPATFLGAIIGSYYVEKIWTIPGTGLLLVKALQGVTPDIDLIEGLTVIYAAISMVSFLLGDLITILFDPRIKLESN